MTIRRRVALELVLLAIATALFLALVPERPPTVDLGLALLSVGLVGVTARDTRARVWGPPGAPRAVRVRRASLQMTAGTLAVTLFFAAYGASRATTPTGDWGQGARHLFRPTLLPALAVFVPWAAAQQTLLQFYLLGRLHALAPDAPSLVIAAANGLLFGLVHLPDWQVTALTVLAGWVWSASYLRDRCLLPIALSHATLGTAYFYWVRDIDLASSWLQSLHPG